MARIFNWFTQVLALTLVGIRTIPQRKGASIAAAVGIAGVVTVLVGVLSIAQGFARAMTVAGKPDNAIVLRSGSDTEMTSNLSREETRIIGDAPGVARSPEGPLSSAELFVIVNLPKRSTGTDANVAVRGVQPSAFRVRDAVEIVAGRSFEWGRNEVIAGVAAAGEYEGLDVGSTLELGKLQWNVVGLFAADGGLAESEIWTDSELLQAAYQRGTSYQTVLARLESADSYTAFKDALTTDPRLQVKVERETEYYQEQSAMITTLITVLGYLVASLMGLGAVFGALNTMYSAVAARGREIATFRALGFHSGPVILAVLAESLVLALMGGVLGAGLAYLVFDGLRTATLNWQSFSQVAFALAVTPQLLASGVFYAMILGFLGGLFPAIRAARRPVALALREL
jgi:putative ABC transport system permease protein